MKSAAVSVTIHALGAPMGCYREAHKAGKAAQLVLVFDSLGEEK
jgi:hypothetical protein